MSYITVQAYYLRIACENYLRQREKSIEEKRQRLIDKEMEKGFFGWFKPSSREEAQQRLEKADGFCNEWDACYYQGIHWADKVRELLACCALSSQVSVDAEMADLLCDYWPR